MNDGMLQSALREMKSVFRSGNLWLTFGAVVALFTVLGPFGTMEALPFLQRLAFWLILHAAAWTIALAFAVLGNVTLRNVLASTFWRMMAGSVVAAIPIGAIIQLIGYLWFGRIPTADAIYREILATVPLSAIFCVISYLAMSSTEAPTVDAGKTQHQPPHTDEQGPSTSRDPSPSASHLMARLKPENRGRLCYMSVEDHYTRVITSRGNELLLLRFADAIREAQGIDGMQVHRSYWVAQDFVSGIERTGGKLTLRLNDGAEIPVSRTYAGRVRALFQPQL